MRRRQLSADSPPQTTAGTNEFESTDENNRDMMGKTHYVFQEDKGEGHDCDSVMSRILVKLVKAIHGFRILEDIGTTRV